VSRRQVRAAGTAFTGYALAADTVLAQAAPESFPRRRRRPPGECPGDPGAEDGWKRCTAWFARYLKA